MNKYYIGDILFNNQLGDYNHYLYNLNFLGTNYNIIKHKLIISLHIFNRIHFSNIEKYE